MSVASIRDKEQWLREPSQGRLLSGGDSISVSYNSSDWPNIPNARLEGPCVIVWDTTRDACVRFFDSPSNILEVIIDDW